MRDNKALVVQNMDDVARASSAMAKSGYFKDAADASKAAVKIMAGFELGFGPFASMTGVSIIKGKPVIGANLLAASIKASGKYNYRVVEHSNKTCKIEFNELFDGKWRVAGISEFTWDDAKTANLTGKDNWKNYPRNMLFARALSNGQKWYAPDATSGATVYTPDELGADVDSDGNAVIEVEAVEVEQPPAAEQEIKELGYERDQLTPALLKDALTIKAANKHADKTEASQQWRGLLAGALNQIFDGSVNARHLVLNWLTGQSSIKEVSAPMIYAINDWLDLGEDKHPSLAAEAEAKAVYREALKEQGQTEMGL